MNEDYVMLGKLLRKRREDLGLTPEKVHTQGGPSAATLRKMERGEPKRRRLDTTFPLEQIYGWSPGSINGFLDFGTTPRVVREPKPEEKTPDLSVIPTAELEKELRSRQ